ncbi:MAG TPA: C25 family cysteine peptidase [Sedimentisphaerales bacterium]|nr:C25 family cysteine peptidase [Sedimentisphaerales bacterium]
MTKIFSGCLWTALAMLTATTALAQVQGTEHKPIWLVATRPMFVQALKPLADMRRKDGFETVISTEPVSEALDGLNRRCAFLLLVGDYQAGASGQPWYVPAQQRQLYKWRAAQQEEFTSDGLWADMDNDLIPDIAVGRIPVRTAEQLKLVIEKIMAFEHRPPTPDDLGLTIWAGSPAYNQVIDGMATWLLLNTVLREAPGWAPLWAISADPMHPLCGWPPEQNSVFAQQLKRGGMMAILMGHGTRDSFFSMRFRDETISYGLRDAEQGLTGAAPGPPTVIIACSCGDFAGADNCLAESLLLTPAGPAAVIGATTESHPLTNYFSGLCLVRQCCRTDKRLGSMWLAAQRKAMETRDLIMERLLVNIEGKLEEKMDMTKLRRDQILMYALLGDPATRLPIPDKLQGRIERVEGGWHWQADKPEDANRLCVSFRPSGLNFPTVELPLAQDGAHKRFEQANAVLGFDSIGEFAGEEPWKGRVNAEGTLRLVAAGQKRIYAVAFELKSGER